MYDVSVLRTCRCGPRALVSVRSDKCCERGVLLPTVQSKRYSLLTQCATTNPSHPPHRLAHLRGNYNIQVGCAASSVGPTLSQPCHQHVSGSSGDGQQRVIATLTCVVVPARSLLAQSVGLADGRVQVDGQRRVPGPAPTSQARRSSSRLTRSSWRT